MEYGKELKKKLNGLIKDNYEIIQLVKNEKSIFTIGNLYQKFFSDSLKIVEFLAPDRYEEYRGYYYPDQKRKDVDVTNYRIQDLLKGFSSTYDSYNNIRLKRPIKRC